MKYKTTQKDRYGNMRSLEIETEGNNLEVPPMGSGIPQYEAVGGLAENHPGDPKGSDTVPAWLTPGEFVVNKEAVDIYGPQIKKMNDIGRDIQDGDMNPNQAPPVYADAGIEVPKSKPKWALPELYYNIFRQEGLNHNSAVGMVANLWAESGLSPSTKQKNKKYANKYLDGKLNPNFQGKKDEYGYPIYDSYFPGQGMGLAQWTENERWQDYLKFAKENKFEPMSREGQTAFIMHELNTKPYASVMDKLKYADSPERATEIILKDYEQAGTPHTEKRIKYAKDLHNYLTIDPGLKEGSQPAWITDAQQLWKDMDKPKVEITEPNPSSGSFLSRWFPSHSGKKKSGSYVEKNPGYFYSGDRVRYRDEFGNPIWPDLEEEVNRILPFAEKLGDSGDDLGHAPTAMPPPPPAPDIPVSDWSADPNKLNPPVVQGDVQEIEDVVDSGFNPWDYEAAMTYKYPVDYPEVTSAQSVPVPSGVDHGFQKELDKKILQNVDSFNPPTNYHLDTHDLGAGIDPNVMQNVPKSEDLIGNLYGSIDSGQGAIPPHSDLLDTIEIPRAGKHPGYNPIGDPTFTSAYDQMVQDEIAGSPAYNIPPPPTDYNFGEHDTGEIPVMPGEEIIVGDGREDYRPSGFVPTMLEANPYTVTEDLQLGDLEKLETIYQDAMNTAMLSNPDDPDFEAKQAHVKKAKEKLDAAKSGHKILDAYRDVAPQFGGEPQWIKDAEARKILADEQATIDELKSRLNDPNITKEYKELLEKKIAEKQAALDAKAAEVQTEAQGNSLEQISKQVDITTEKEITDKLNSKEGKKALEDGSSNKEEVSKTRKMFDFLFGDLIDKGEIGRAIAVYLGSRALGYDHGSSIGYVAKQYLKRVDAKNAQMDKWILANAHLYTKDSLAEFKRTKDPSKLIRIGATPRSAGGRKMFYHKDWGERQGFEFKIKNAQGDDETYWSFDITGKDKLAKVGSGWTETDSRIIPKESINDIEKIIKGFQESSGGKKVINKGGKNQRTIYFDSGTDTPSLNATAVADEVAGWLYERGIRPGKFKQPIYEALAQAVAENRKLISEGEDAKEIGSLIPWLEEATIKVRLEDMMDSKGRLIPSPVKATVDGKEITMDTKRLVELQQRIESFYGVKGADKFWAATADQWGDRLPGDKKKTYRDAYIDEFKKALKDKSIGNEYTPFALFAANRIETILRKAAKETAQQ